MLERILTEIETKGYSYTEGLIGQDELKAINEFFRAHRSEFVPAMIGPLHSKQRDESIRGDYTFWVDPLSPIPEVKGLIDFLNRLLQGLNARFYLGLKQFECHFAFYPPGTFYKKHSDRFETSSTRTLSFIFYLNEEWNSGKGGELVLFDRGNNLLQTIVPLPGSFVCFLSEEFPHEVKKATQERRSLTGWMHTKILY